MRRIPALVTFVASSLAAPVAAQSLSDVPTVWDATLGAGSGATTVSGAISRSTYLGTSDKLRVGFLLRGTFETGTMDLDPVDPRGLGTPDRMRTPTGSAMINVGVNFGYEATPRFMVGANFDLFGITVGQGQNATLTNAGSGGETAVVPVKPDSPNLFEGGGDKGSLNSELFVGWALNDRYTIRGGLSRQLVQYRLSGAQAITASSTNYSRTANVIFIGLRYTPPQ